MNGDPLMTEREPNLIRKVAGRLGVIMIALLLALSFPAVGTDLTAGGALLTAPSHQSVGSLANPDVANLTLAAETPGEFDRSRTGAPPMIVNGPADQPRRVDTASSVFAASVGTKMLCPAAALPPGCGPPSVS